MTEWKVDYKSADVGTFAYLKVGREKHGRPSFLLWVGSKLIQSKDGRNFVTFPCHGAQICKTEKGNLVLRAAAQGVVYDIYEQCGYRGASYLKVLSPENSQTK